MNILQVKQTENLAYIEKIWKNVQKNWENTFFVISFI